MASNCGQGDDCQPKCCPILTQSLPNDNRSHVHPQLLCKYGQPSGECAPKECVGAIKGLPVSSDPAGCPSCYDVSTGHQRQCECEECLKKRKGACPDFCEQHADGNAWQDLKKYSLDPDVQALRDRLGSSICVKESLKWCPDDEWLTCVDRRFRQAKTGLLGKSIVHYGAAQDRDFPKEMIHGVRSKNVNLAAKLVNPRMKTWPEQLDIDLSESIYASNRLAPIGKSHDQLPHLPAKIDPEETTFGAKSNKDISAGLLINPPKNRYEVEAESNCCRQMYRKTHGGFKAGEQICRNYEEPFSRTSTFGIPTPCDVAGRWCRKVMSTWRSCTPDMPYVNKVYADHLDQRYPKLGLSQDRHCIARTKGHCHTYGTRNKLETEERPIREIIFNRCPDPNTVMAEKMMHSLKTWLDKVRKSFRAEVGPNLEEFYEALQENDEDRNGTVSWEGFLRALKQERVPCLENRTEFMEALMLVQIYHPLPCNKLNYYSLMDYIKGYEDPKFCAKTTTLRPWYTPWTNGCTHFRTSYSDFSANWCLRESCLQHLREQTVHGRPSVKNDGDAYSLICPSAYTLRGVTCRDAFSEITREQMVRVLCEAAVAISHEEFDKVWKKAQEIDPDGKDRVCYQTFREALHICRDTENRMYGYSEEPKVHDCCHGLEPDVCCLCQCRKRKDPCATGI